MSPFLQILGFSPRESHAVSTAVDESVIGFSQGAFHFRGKRLE